MKNLFYIGVASLVFMPYIYTENMSLRVPHTIIQQIEHNAQSWTQIHKNLSPESLELLANFLYLSYRHAYLDEQTGNALIELKTKLPLLRTQLRSHHNPIPTTKAYLHASKRFFAYNGLRYHAYLCWQRCLEHLETTQDSALRNAYEQLQREGQRIMADYLTSTPTVSISMTQIQHHLKQATEQLHEISYGIEALFEKMITNTQVEDAVIDTDRALHTSNQIQKITDTIYVPIAAIDQHQNNLLFVATYIFGIYYCTLYTYVSPDRCRLLFGPHAKIEEHNFHRLPSSDSIKNLLQITA